MLGRTLLGVGALSFVVLVGSGLSSADEKKKEDVAQSPEHLGKGPTLQETGRVGAMTVETSGLKTSPAASAGAPLENSVRLAASSEDRAPPTARQGVIEPAVLEREISARFAETRFCRIEVARRKQVAPAMIPVKSLALRWTILPSGTVTATQIIALAPTEPELIGCLKQRMAQWVFTRPRGGPLVVDRMLTLR